MAACPGVPAGGFVHLLCSARSVPDQADPFPVPVPHPCTLQFRFFAESLKTSRMKSYVQMMVMEAEQFFDKWPDSGEVGRARRPPPPRSRTDWHTGPRPLTAASAPAPSSVPPAWRSPPHRASLLLPNPPRPLPSSQVNLLKEFGDLIILTASRCLLGREVCECFSPPLHL